MSSFDVIIIGYGPVGQTLALMLARQGRKVAVAATGAVELFLGWDVLEITQDGTLANLFAREAGAHPARTCGRR